MFMIVGLGNPGRRYLHSRHNVGYQVARKFCERHSIRLRSKRKLRSRIGVGEVGGRRVVAVEPTTFMNRSGEAVASAVGFYGVNPKDLLVIVDDVNLPIGKVRIRKSGSDGGHNGLRSVIGWLGTTDFARLRIGIGRPARAGAEERGRAQGEGWGSWRGERARPGDQSGCLTDFVLGDFSKEERAVVGEAVERAADALEALIKEGMSEAMNRYNRSRDPSARDHAGKEGLEENIVRKTNERPGQASSA